MKYTYEYLEDSWIKGKSNLDLGCIGKKIRRHGMSKNPNLTWETIQNNPRTHWNWDILSLHPHITWETIQNNLDKEWNWEQVSCNTMKIGKDCWINDLRLRLIKALQIQRHWRMYSSNPEYKLARRLIEERLDI